MSTFIQIHTLTSHSSHCLNRDDLGHPKTLHFLGQTHGRISSQCQKRAIREFMRDQEMTGRIGLRTKKLPRIVKEYLLEKGVEKSIALPLIPVVAALGEKSPPSDANMKKYVKLAEKDKDALSDKETKEVERFERTAQLVHIKLTEIDTIKETALRLCREGNTKGEVLKQFKKSISTLMETHRFNDSVDIAMFGRMTTSPVFDDCDAAIPVAHALTTDPVFDQTDFFTAVDDLGEEGQGSGHMDDKAFTSGVYYRYANINYDLLLKNMNQDEVLTREATLAFLKAFVLALPTGSQNAFAAYQQPYAILVTAGSGCPTNLSNAFSRKLKNGNPLKRAVKNLVDEFSESQVFFGDLKPVSHAFVACQYDGFLDPSDHLISCGDVGHLITSVGQTLEAL
jgi:CRISPR system Cascade subunit CasC